MVLNALKVKWKNKLKHTVGKQKNTDKYNKIMKNNRNKLNGTIKIHILIVLCFLQKKKNKLPLLCSYNPLIDQKPFCPKHKDIQFDLWGFEIFVSRTSQL